MKKQSRLQFTEEERADPTFYQGYLDVKNDYPNDIVLYPLGDFYEVLGTDAEFAAKTLDLRSTYRIIGLDDERVPMCSFPSHVLEQYTQKLLDSGRNVVLVSMEDGERKPYFIRSTANEQTAEVTAEQEAADTVQAAPSITPAEITKADIDTALQLWNGDTASKRKVTEYMESHSRERGTAEWLKKEFGGNLPAFTVTKGDLSLELPWAKVQRHIGQLVAEAKFFTDVKYDKFADVDFGELRERLASDEPSPFVEQVISDAERIVAKLTLEMYDTESTELFQVKKGSYLATVEVNAPKEIWERFAENGLVPNEDSENRLVFETDGNNWNRFIIPDTYGNKSNNIKADDVLTPEEYKTMQAVVQKIIPAGEKQIETAPIPYTKGDTVYLENGTPFFIEEITDNQVTLRDPSLYYPILRAESRESFLQLLERYPQTGKAQEKAEDFRITDTHLGEGGKREKFQRNIAAITTLQTLERENRPATKEEQETLSQYVGWGGLPDVFDESKDNWHGEYLQLKDLLTEDEYEMARASTLNAHYTSPTVINE